MGLFDHFPYTNFHELNLDWILNMLKKIDTTMDEFVSLNALKYADPIQWDITRQYEKNTIVIDPLTGTAYLSVQAVPSGVAITNPDYWTVVFDLSRFIIRAAQNFTSNFEDASTLISSYNLAINDWVVWGDVLYRVIAPISIGDYYVVGTNIQHFTIEDIIGHIEDLTTSDTTSIVNAINSIITERGTLASLTTSDNTSIVGAINEINDKYYKIKVTDLPASWGLDNLVADGVTDNTAAFNALVSYISTLAPQSYRRVLYFPTGSYLFESTITLPTYLEIEGEGALATRIFTNTLTGAPLIIGQGYNRISDLNVQHLGSGLSNNSGIELTGIQCEIYRIRIYNFKNGIKLSGASGTKLEQVYIESNIPSFVGVLMTDRCVSSKFFKTNVVGNGIINGTGFYYASGEYCMDMQFLMCETAQLAYGFIFEGGSTTYPGDLVINHCTFDGMHQSFALIKGFNNSGSVTFVNNWVNYAEILTNVKMFDIQNSSNITIANNKLESLNSGAANHLRAVDITNGHNIIVSGNIMNTVQYGMVVNVADHITFVDNIIENLDTGVSGTAMINATSMTYSSILNNKLKGAVKYSYDMLLYTCTYDIIKNNIIESTSQSGYTDATCIISDNINY